MPMRDTRRRRTARGNSAWICQALAEPRALFIYERVKQFLNEQIFSGALPPGSRVPSEHMLMRELGASRMTVHRALREMSAQGVLHRVQGVGTFVRRPPASSALLEIFDISQDILQRGGEHGARIIRLGALRADAALASAFELERGARIFHSEIVHLENGVPVQLETRYVSPHFAPDYLEQDFSAQTTSRYLLSIAPAAEVEHIVRAVLPDRRGRALLQVDAAEPCLLVERRTWTAAGPATYSRLTHPGSRYQLGSRYTPRLQDARKDEANKPRSGQQ